MRALQALSKKPLTRGFGAVASVPTPERGKMSQFLFGLIAGLVAIAIDRRINR